MSYRIAILTLCVYSTVAIIAEQKTLGYKLPRQVITGDPVGPYIADKKGTGFCASSKQALYYSDFSSIYDPGNIFGSESRQVPRACYETNITSQGVYLPRFMNCFFDGLFFPSQSGGTVQNAKFPRSLFIGETYMIQPFDFSDSLDVRDPNGDFRQIVSGTATKGTAFPVMLGPNLKNYDPNLRSPQNRFKNPLWARTYPEASDDDVIRDTATRFRAMLNVPATWVGKNVLFGIYADDATAVSIYDNKQNQYSVISAGVNRCEACNLDENFPCKTPDPKNPGKLSICKSIEICKSDADCSGKLLGTCDLSTHTCTKELTCNTNSDCGLGGSCDFVRHVCTNRLWCQPCDLTQTGMRWRVTNQVIFPKEGLYPIEIIHIQNAGEASLELSYRVLATGETFSDIYESWGFPLSETQKIADTYFNAQSAPLSSLGFQILDSSMLFQTKDGRALDCEVYGQCRLTDPSLCTDPRFRNPIFQNTVVACQPGTSCNPAGLCEPCTTKDACGDGICEMCKGNQTCRLINGRRQCAECERSSDCKDGQSCEKGICVCSEDRACEKGQRCNGGRCEVCNSSNACAGNSCSCCPGNAGQCVQMDPADPKSYTCVECKTTKDCNPAGAFGSQKVCDPVNHRCVDTIPPCNTNDRCGEQCKACPNDRPICLDGKVCVSCRTDTDCPTTQYCLSGQCTSCSTDKKCGDTCRSCPAQKPFCYSQGAPAVYQCVRCFKDEQCGEGGTCDPNTNQCQNRCTASCKPNEVCQGNRCVQCISSAQCPCGESCDPVTHRCLQGCQDTSDCLPDECCSSQSHQCFIGHCATGIKLVGGALCCSNTDTHSGESEDQTPQIFHISIAIFMAMIGLSVFFQRKRR